MAMASLNFVNLSLLPSTHHSLAAAQSWPSFRPIISRIILTPCFCSSSSSPTSPLLSILDKPPLSEQRADFASLISYFQSTQKSRRVEESLPVERTEEGSHKGHAPPQASNTGDVPSPADVNRAYNASERDSALFLQEENSVCSEDELSSAEAKDVTLNSEDQASVSSADEKIRVSESSCEEADNVIAEMDNVEAEMDLSGSYGQAMFSDAGQKNKVSDSAEDMEVPSREYEASDMASSDAQELELATQYKRVPQAHWAALLRGLCENGGVDVAIRLLNWIRKYRFRVFYDELFSIIINGLGKDHRFFEAMAVADQLEVKGAHMYHALLGACWINNEFSLLLEFLRKMRQDGLRPDITNYTFATQACMKEKVQSHVIVELYEDMLKDKIQIDEKLYNDVIYAVSMAGNADQGLRVMQDMRFVGFVPSVIAYNAVMFALGQTGRMDEVESVLEEMKSRGRIPKVRTYNTIIRGYARKGQLDRAEEVLQFMGGNDIEPNEQTYSFLIDACAKAGKLEKAWALFLNMKAAGLRPTPFIYGRLMTAFKAAGQWQSAIKTLRKMQEAGIPPNRHVYNITIDAFGKHKRSEKALDTFRTMRVKGVQPDAVSWNSLIECQFRAGQKERALQLFSRMKQEGCAPNHRTYNILISWLGQLKYWDDLRDILQDMKGNSLVPNSVTYTTLVDVYGRAGRFQDASECLEIMRAEASQPEPGVYCALANAYARQGLSEQAVGVFKRMEADGIKTNLLMLNSVLNSFSVAAKPEEALSVFDYIVEYGMTPDLVTYTTLMKGYINAEQYEEAVLVFDRMIKAGVTPDKRARDMRRLVERYSGKPKKPQLT